MLNVSQNKEKSKVVGYYHCQICRQMVLNSQKSFVIREKACFHKFHQDCLTLSKPAIKAISNHVPYPAMPRKIKRKLIFAEMNRMDLEFKRSLLEE